MSNNIEEINIITKSKSYKQLDKNLNDLLDQLELYHSSEYDIDTFETYLNILFATYSNTKEFLGNYRLACKFLGASKMIERLREKL